MLLVFVPETCVNALQAGEREDQQRREERDPGHDRREQRLLPQARGGGRSRILSAHQPLRIGLSGVADRQDREQEGPPQDEVEREGAEHREREPLHGDEGQQADEHRHGQERQRRRGGDGAKG